MDPNTATLYPSLNTSYESSFATSFQLRVTKSNDYPPKVNTTAAGGKTASVVTECGSESEEPP